MTVAVSGESITFNDSSVQNTAATGFGFKNRIINGAMVIDQRNAGAAVTINSVAYTYGLDRWSGLGQATDGVFTIQRSTVAPAGFINSFLSTVTTADASIGASQFYILRHAIEGFNIADLGWGAAGAATVTLSFWVRSSLTGSFSGSLTNSAYNRAYPFSFTINAANTFEYKTITIAGDTSGTWLTDSGIGISVYFDLGSGSSNKGTANAWNAGGLTGVTGSVNLIATNGATFYITGVQLEKGSTATSFDYRPYGTELALCQRYYQRYSYVGIDGYAVGSGSGNALSSSFWWTVQMRAAPTVTFGTAAFSSNTSNTTPDITVIAPTSSYLLTQLTPSAAGRAYLYNPVFASSEL
jgi:hypothetical protein